MNQPGLIDRLRDTFSWQSGDRADPSGWWRDPDLLREITAALAQLHAESEPTVVIGVPARGTLLGPLVAQHLGLGFVEVRKDLKNDGQHGTGLLRRSTPPDYNQRNLTLTLRKGLIRPRDRALLVDDWIATGAQATAAARLVDDSEGSFVGVSVIVDATTAATRRALDARGLLSIRQLPD